MWLWISVCCVALDVCVVCVVWVDVWMCVLCVCLQAFHDRLKAEQDILEQYDVEDSCKFITVCIHYVYVCLSV